MEKHRLKENNVNNNNLVKEKNHKKTPNPIKTNKMKENIINKKKTMRKNVK